MTPVSSITIDIAWSKFHRDKKSYYSETRVEEFCSFLGITVQAFVDWCRSDKIDCPFSDPKVIAKIRVMAEYAPENWDVLFKVIEAKYEEAS